MQKFDSEFRRHDSSFGKNEIRSLVSICVDILGEDEASLALLETSIATSVLGGRDTADVKIDIARILISRAQKIKLSALKFNHPFYRLNILERFTLSALHREKWSYHQVAQALQTEIKSVESIAWASRLKLCFELSEQSHLEYPHGPSKIGPVCPEYDPSQPWSQRLLDDELGKRERLFLQSHLMACQACQDVLTRTRKLFFRVEALLPSSLNTEMLERHSLRLLSNYRAGKKSRDGLSDATLLSSLSQFFAIPSVQWTLAALIVLFVLWFK